MLTHAHMMWDTPPLAYKLMWGSPLLSHYNLVATSRPPLRQSIDCILLVSLTVQVLVLVLVKVAALSVEKSITGLPHLLQRRSIHATECFHQAAYTVASTPLPLPVSSPSPPS